MRSVTGSNLRHIMLLLNKFDLTYVSPEDALNIEYHTISESDKWRLNILDELFELQHGDLVVPGMEDGEISTILDYICTS